VRFVARCLIDTFNTGNYVRITSRQSGRNDLLKQISQAFPRLSLSNCSCFVSLSSFAPHFIIRGILILVDVIYCQHITKSCLTSTETWNLTRTQLRVMHMHIYAYLSQCWRIVRAFKNPPEISCLPRGLYRAKYLENLGWITFNFNGF